MKLDERLLGPEDNVAFYCPVDRYRYLWFSRAVRELAAGFWCELCDVEISYPFTHRPLVEFMFAIPIGQVVRPQESRSLLRRSLSDLLPQKIATRRGKTLNTEALLLAVAREAPRLRKLFANATVCARGYVDSEALLVTLDWASQGGDLRALPLICLGPLEYWLRACESRCFGKDQNRSLSLKPAPMPTVLQTQGFDQVSEAARASWRQALMLPTYVIG